MTFRKKTLIFTFLAAMVFSSVANAASETTLEDVSVLPIFSSPEKEVLILKTNSSDLRTAGMAWFKLAGLEVDDAATEAVLKFDQLVESGADDPLTRAYLGSAYIMKARDSFFIPMRVRRVRTGLKYLNSAMEDAPDNYAVRLLRASSTYNLPDIFDYRGAVISDLEWLVAKVGSGDPAPVVGSIEHGRLIAALAKMHLIQKQPEQAQPWVSLLERDFQDVDEISSIAMQLRALMKQ